MNPVSPPIPVPSAGVWVPLHLAELLFDCYYGGGPRFQDRLERRANPPPTITRGEPVPAADPFRPSAFSGVSDMPPGVRPGGLLARQALHPSKPSNTAKMGGDQDPRPKE